MVVTPQDQSRIDFVLHLRRRWADRLYPALRAQFDCAMAESPRADTAQTIHDLPSYRWFAFLERNSQKALWRAVADAVGDAPDAPAAANGPAHLERNPDCKMPDWYAAIDFHVQPNGVWSSGKAARVYELGAKLVMLGENDDYLFHRLFAQTAVPKRDYRRIVDFGCGFGKSAWPLKQTFPQAQVIGVDLALPCLEMATQKCNALGLEVTFREADCAATGLETGSADLVTSTMLVHELPPEHLAATIREAARLLAPGGLLRFLDFHETGDAFRDLAMREHGERNNEPFLPMLFDTDVPALCKAAGFAEANWVAFDETGAGRLDSLAWRKRPEWHFPWAVLEARKAA